MLKKILIMAASMLVCVPVFAADTPVTTPQASAQPNAQPNAQPSGEMMGNTCAGCHGTQGRMVSEAFMPLAGMKQSTFIKGMTDFRSGARPASLMGHVARGYTDEQIKAMAEYFAAIKP